MDSIYRNTDARIDPAHVTPFLIEAGDTLSRVSIGDFRGTGIMPAALALYNAVQILTSALQSAGILRQLTAAALIEHLRKVIEAAEVLRARLEAWEANNPHASIEAS